MKNIGQILKDARVKRKYSLSHVEEVTKIKKNFIGLIEKERWEELPPFATVLGFVKNLASATGVDAKTAVAVLKRDYPPKNLNINPKPDAVNRFIWSPKITFVAGIIAVILVIFGYLGLQYFRFVSPPHLTVNSPKEGQEVSGNSVLVFGSTDLDVKITVNNQPVLTDSEGKFSVSVPVAPTTKEIDVAATARSGKMTEVKRAIKIVD